MTRCLIIVAVAATALGCTETTEPEDAGRVIRLDAGPEIDAGDAPDAGPTDAGAPDAGALCTARPVAMQDACAESTRQCWSGCTTQQCVDDCVGADPSPGCATCFAVNQIVCIADAGCDGELRDLDCCREAMCPAEDLSQPACADDSCAFANTALIQCGADRLGFGGCAGAVTDCF